MKDGDILADICAMTGLMWAHRGFLEKATIKQKQAHDIRARAKPLDRLELSWTEIKLGNLAGCKGHYEGMLE